MGRAGGGEKMCWFRGEEGGVYGRLEVGGLKGEKWGFRNPPLGQGGGGMLG